MGKICLLKKKDLKIESKLKLCEAYKNYPKKERQKMYRYKSLPRQLDPSCPFFSLYTLLIGVCTSMTLRFLLRINKKPIV